MKLKVYVVAVITKGDALLMRKKPDGSPPYRQTWYLFHGELEPGRPWLETVQAAVRTQTGVEITHVRQLGWDTEVKAHTDGETKQFVYLENLFDYDGGELQPGPGIEKLEWAPKAKLARYDLVPPSVKLFKRLGWLKA